MNKKGIFGSLMVDPWFIIAFVFILVIFYLLFTLTVSRTSIEIEGRWDNLDNELNFINFLRMSIDNNNILDLFYFYTKEKKDEIADKILENARFYLKGDYCIKVLIENNIIDGKYFNDCGSYLGFEVDSFNFRNFDGKEMNILLYKSNKEFEENFCSVINLQEDLCLNWFNCYWDSNQGCKKI